MIHAMPAFSFAKWPSGLSESSSNVPSSTTWPLCTTIILLHFWIVDMRWAMTMLVRPSIARSSAYCTISWLCSSSADVASSKIKILGFFIRARAMATLCFWPPESLEPLSPQTFSNPGCNCYSCALTLFLSMSSSNNVLYLSSTCVRLFRRIKFWKLSSGSDPSALIFYSCCR